MLWSPSNYYYESESESEVAQSCPTLCDPVDCTLPGSSIHGIFQAIVLEWIAISFSRGSSRPRDRTQVSHIAGRRFNLWAIRADTPLPSLPAREVMNFIHLFRKTIFSLFCASKLYTCFQFHWFWFLPLLYPFFYCVYFAVLFLNSWHGCSPALFLLSSNVCIKSYKISSKCYISIDIFIIFQFKFFWNVHNFVLDPWTIS